jgi:hypothetical protein
LPKDDQIAFLPRYLLVAPHVSSLPINPTCLCLVVAFLFVCVWRLSKAVVYSCSWCFSIPQFSDPNNEITSTSTPTDGSGGGGGMLMVAAAAVLAM